MLTIIKSQALQVMIYTTIIAQVVFSCGNNQDTANSILNVSKKRPPTVILRVQPICSYDPLVLGRVYANYQLTEISFYLSRFSFMGARTESDTTPVLLQWKLLENRTIQTQPDSIAFCIPPGTYNDFAFQIGVDSFLLDSTYCTRHDTIFKESSSQSRPQIDKVICVEEAGTPFTSVAIRGYFDANGDGTTETPFEMTVSNQQSQSLIVSRYHGSPILVSADGKPTILTYKLDVWKLISQLAFKGAEPKQIVSNLNKALLIQE